MKTYQQTSIFAEALPVELEPELPEVRNVMVTNQRIDKKSGDLILDVRATTTTMNVPLITKEVLAKGFLRAVVEYMANDISAVMDELVVIYARQSVIAEINKITAEGDKPDTKQFETMVQQKIWEIRHTLTNYQRIFTHQHLHDEAQGLLDGMDELTRHTASPFDVDDEEPDFEESPIEANVLNDDDSELEQAA